MENIKFEANKKIARARFHVRNLGRISMLDSNSPPSVFVGSRLRYPLVNVGILSPLQRDEHAWIYDNARYWSDNNFGISDVLQMRNSLINSRFKATVQDARSRHRFLHLAKEIATASKPVDVEIHLKNSLKTQSMKDPIVTPHGMRASLQQAKITGNVSVLPAVERFSDDDVKASEALTALYQKHKLDETSLSKMLSIGVFGMRKQRKLVPTRWSITATDDTLAKSMLKKIRELKQINDYQLFTGGFMGNEYLILIFPGVWSYELFELYWPGSSWNPSREMKASTDFEGFSGRKNYASNTAGGYYAARLGIVEYLHKIKRQASILAIRLELPTYWAALGVWVVRESVRKTMNNPCKDYATRDELLRGAVSYGKENFNFDCEFIYEKSKLLKQLKTQISLRNFINT
jgi:hypothetical protein